MIIFGCICMFAGTVCADICTSVPDTLLFRLPLS